MCRRSSRTLIERRDDSLFAQANSSTSCAEEIPFEPIAKVVPHGQFASDSGPIGSTGISPLMSSYRTGVERWVVAFRYSRSESNRRPHFGQTLGNRPSMYDRTI